MQNKPVKSGIEVHRYSKNIRRLRETYETGIRHQFFDIYILFSKLRGIKTILEKKDNEFQR